MPASMVLASILAAVSVWIAFGIYFDCKYLRLPNSWLKIGVIVVASALSVITYLSSAHVIFVISGSLLAGLIWFASYLIIGMTAPLHLGGGDIKLAFICGAWIGVVHLMHRTVDHQSYSFDFSTAATLFVAVSVTMVVANCFTLGHFLIRAAFVGKHSHMPSDFRIPHGPSMMLATITVCCHIGL